VALFERPIVITNAAYRFIMLEQLAEVGLRPMSCSSRCGGIPRRSPPAQPLRTCAATAVLALAADRVVRDTPAFVAARRQGTGCRGRGEDRDPQLCAYPDRTIFVPSALNEGPGLLPAS